MHYENEKTVNTFSDNSNTDECVQTKSDGLSVAKVLYAISDDKSLSLFNTIAISLDGPHSGEVGQILISHMNLTRKQYYQRINRLRSLGLITRKKARYSLSSLGRILYETQKTIEIAIQNRWKLAALDTLESSLTAEGMPVEDRIRFINTLLKDCDEIKNILLCNNGRQSYLDV